MTQDIEEKWMEVYRVQTAAIERLEQQNAELLADAKKAIWRCVNGQPHTAARLLREAIAKAGA